MSSDASFWDWAIGAYGRPGVAEACLELQDQHAQSVPYLLWAAWAARTGRTLAPPRLTEGAALAARWEEAVVLPLRQLRRRLKAPFPGLDEAAKSAFRQQVKAVELEAERVLMSALEVLAPEAAGEPISLTSALLAARAVWPSPVPDQALRALTQNLP